MCAQEFIGQNCRTPFSATDVFAPGKAGGVLCAKSHRSTESICIKFKPKLQEKYCTKHDKQKCAVYDCFIALVWSLVSLAASTCSLPVLAIIR
jgi:hypothetical protein